MNDVSGEITAETPIHDCSTVRMRADVMKELAELSRAPVSHESERSELDNRTRKVWHSRLGAWLRNHLPMAQKSLVDRALDRKGKAAFLRIAEAHERELREVNERGKAALENVIATARKSHAATTQYRDASHAIILQRLIVDAQGLGHIVGKKLREGSLNHTESTLVDEEYLFTDEFLKFLEFQ